MIRLMLKTFGRSILHFFARPAPTSVALMVGANGGTFEASREDAQLLRRAMQAATAAEEARAEPVSAAAPVFEAEPEAAAPAVEEPADEIEAVPEIAVEAEASDDFEASEDIADASTPAVEDSDDGAVGEEIDTEAADEEPTDDPVEPSADELALCEERLEAAVDFAVEALAAEELAMEEAAAILEDVEATGADADDAIPEEATAPTFVEAAEAEVEPTSEEAIEPAREDLDAPAAEQAVAAAEADEASCEPEPEAADEVVEKKPRKKRAAGKRKASSKSASRKSKAAEQPAEPVPEDDVWVSDAVAWSLSGEWRDGEWSPPEGDDCPRRLEELREAAAEGRLTIWGRTDDAGTWQPIEASYWKSGTVEPASLWQGRENVVAEPKAKARSKKAARKYSALKVSKSQIEELWSPEAIH